MNQDRALDLPGSRHYLVLNSPPESVVAASKGAAIVLGLADETTLEGQARRQVFVPRLLKTGTNV